MLSATNIGPIAIRVTSALRARAVSAGSPSPAANAVEYRSPGRSSALKARSAAIAEGITLECIHRLKYQKEPWFGTFLSGLLMEAALPRLIGHPWQGVVPVPLHRVKHREREFNQAERLAAPLAHALSVPLETNRVRRREATSSQTSLSREDRISNMRTAFEPARSPQIHGSWIIVDDVLTTGATTDGVAAVLKNLGAERVVVWAVARAVLEIHRPPTRQA